MLPNIQNCKLQTTRVMNFRSFYWALITGTVTIFAIIVTSLGWIGSQSAISLVLGGNHKLPQAVKFLPKQSPAMVSLLTNPDKLYAWREVSLPWERRKRDHTHWQKWSNDLFAKIGFDYQKDLKPWLEDEITFAITTLDLDRNPGNGLQTGYLLGLKTKNTQLAQASINKYYQEQEKIVSESYKGVKIRSHLVASHPADNVPWSSAVVGDFVLFANQPQILKTAINQAQAVNLNLANADTYQKALGNISQPHIAIAYIDVVNASAWLDKSLIQSSPKDILSASLSINASGLTANTVLAKNQAAKFEQNSPETQSILDNPELNQIFESLPFDSHDFAYIDLQQQNSLLEANIPLYKVTKLAIKSLLPHLKAISIKNLDPQENLTRARIVFELDA